MRNVYAILVCLASEQSTKILVPQLLLFPSPCRAVSVSLVETQQYPPFPSLTQWVRLASLQLPCAGQTKTQFGTFLSLPVFSPLLHFSVSKMVSVHPGKVRHYICVQRQNLTLTTGSTPAVKHCVWPFWCWKGSQSRTCTLTAPPDSYNI